MSYQTEKTYAEQIEHRYEPALPLSSILEPDDAVEPLRELKGPQLNPRESSQFHNPEWLKP